MRSALRVGEGAYNRLAGFPADDPAVSKTPPDRGRSADLNAADLKFNEAGPAKGPFSPDLLRAHQRLRRPDNLLMLAMTDGLDRLFSSDNPLLRLARDVRIAAVHRAPPLKRLLMRRAMGLGARPSVADRS